MVLTGTVKCESQIISFAQAQDFAELLTRGNEMVMASEDVWNLRSKLRRSAEATISKSFLLSSFGLTTVIRLADVGAGDLKYNTIHP